MKTHGTFWAVTTILWVIAASLTSCALGPNYQRPALDVPKAFKSAATQPAAAPRLDLTWWRLFGDKTLAQLEESALQGSQDLKAAMARVAEARASSAAVRSQFFPTITFDPSVLRNSTPGTGNSKRPEGQTSVQIPFDLGYEIDIWGRVRRSFESSEATAQASEIDAQVVRLTLLADVAVGYFTLRSLDAQDEILTRNIDLYHHQIDLTQTQFRTGITDRTAVLQAQVQLDSTLTQLTELRRQRADQEHALAILTGRPPSELSLKVKPLDLAPPEIPPGLPIDLLRYRPDVAEAEQNLRAANALIGVAVANFFPVVKLSGAAGFENNDAANVSQILNWKSRFWSLGPTVTAPIFEGGLLTANLAQAKAKCIELQATYRGTVLTAFQNVEDALTDMHMQAGEAQSQARAVANSREYLALAVVQYRKGLITYLQVIDAERTLLTNEITAAQILNQRLAATVTMIKALGGGWDAQTPPLQAATSKPSTAPSAAPRK
jgi:multidrug efflux system outer membrane protein